MKEEALAALQNIEQRFVQNGSIAQLNRRIGVRNNHFSASH
jgi:hypothetical protein